ncbi:MAG: MerR family transcriptional regulator [Anaerolineae bacterium]|nr:MerR family transcriptional regulator [Thermoflexales bacterium]MDW8395078.1 MerR family transcriptional regulator [Anaerolineae bacterium]
MFDAYSTDPVYNVKAVAQQTGVSTATLRAWERRYGVPSPPRTEAGYRLYSARDVAIVRWLKTQIDSGLSISHAVQLLHVLEGRYSREDFVPEGSEQPASRQRLHDDIVAAAVEFNEEQIEQSLSESFALFSVEDVCVGIIEPALATIGELWHAGEISVSVEHFLTNIVRRRLLAIMAALPSPIHEARVVSACAPQEYHEIGLLMISLFLRRQGYGVTYLGQNIATARLWEALEKTRPSVLLLSASGLIAAANLLDLVRELRARGYVDLRIAFGGQIYRRLPHLVRCVQAVFLGENAREAVARLKDLLSNAAGLPEAHNLALPVEDCEAGTHELVSALRITQPAIVADMLHRAQSNGASPIAHIQLPFVGEHLLELIIAALRYQSPDALRDLNSLRWDALSPDGTPTAALAWCAELLTDSAQALLPEGRFAHLAPYFQALHHTLSAGTQH